MESSRPPADGGADEALRRLEERLDRASNAAERLLAEAAGSAARVAKAAVGQTLPPDPAGPPPDPPGPPPAGWQLPGEKSAPEPRGDFAPLAQVLGSLRELIPSELERRLADALRELLLAIRALIDWYLERSERRRAAPAEVQDIPIS